MTGTSMTRYLEQVQERPRRSWWALARRRFLRNRVAILAALYLVAMYLVALLAPFIAPYDPNEGDILYIHARPSSEHLLGTDENGRDVLSRLIYGARISMSVGLIAMVISIAIGSLIGGVSGYAGRVVDSVLMRITDGMMAIPYFFLVLIVVAVFGSSFRNIVLVIGVTSWMVVARIVRSEVLRTRELDFVLAARALGASSTRILLRHILPHAVPSIIVAATLGVANAILLESALSYLGLGIQPPQASWGNMLSNSQAYLWENPLLPLYPGLLILLTVLAYNFLGDALRDALDPQYREGQL
ncbi:ABC transporter permease [Thermomicrobiaceae bacterium CFH 74404]|uniref:ABC transporter permease n=1 Tax=Thermalbibacter longus TaxID=2951981 RepID=A0AA41WFV4_9BACT|nr:ABC transporter permease [Thermalbibacter longus]MCM8749338.1 ABC transporter permease [Thermalbibacter longus]